VTARVKPPWRITLEKRARTQERMVQTALLRLEGGNTTFNTKLDPARALGIHLGLVALANCTPRQFELRDRARWVLHWLLDYLVEQGYTVADVASDSGLAALEAIAVIAGAAKEPRELRLKAVNRVLHLPDGQPIDDSWQEVYQGAWQFINGLHGVAR
jgi:hypothetical protein